MMIWSQGTLFRSTSIEFHRYSLSWRLITLTRSLLLKHKSLLSWKQRQISSAHVSAVIQWWWHSSMQHASRNRAFIKLLLGDGWSRGIIAIAKGLSYHHITSAPPISLLFYKKQELQQDHHFLILLWRTEYDFRSTCDTLLWVRLSFPLLLHAGPNSWLWRHILGLRRSTWCFWSMHPAVHQKWHIC